MIQHEYLTDVAYVKSLGVYYAIFTLGFLVITGQWIWLVWKKFKDQSTGLQKGLTILPILKLLQVHFYWNYVTDCPWKDQIYARYMLMLIVTMATMYQAILITFLLLLSKGWKIARQSLRRSDISNFTIIMGAIYLVYSAYYVTLTIPAMFFFLNVRYTQSLIKLQFVLTLQYVLIFMMVLRQTIDTLDMIKDEFLLARAGNSEVFYPCLILKGVIMKRYLLVVLVYFLYEIGINGIIPIFS